MLSRDNTTSELKICPLCGREIPPHLESRHHLTPRSQGGKNGPIAILHKPCHSKIHSVFTEKQLARDLETIEKLLAHEEIARFVKWISKRPIDFAKRNRRMKEG